MSGFATQIEFSFDVEKFERDWESNDKREVEVEERVKVDREALMVIQQLGDVELSVLQVNRLDTIQVSSTRGVEEVEGGYESAIGELIPEKDALNWALKHNRPFAKRLVKKDKGLIMKAVYDAENAEDCLKNCRLLRRVFPFNDYLSKRIDSASFGHSTYGKFMEGINRWKLRGPFLVFGVAGQHHAMSSMDNVVKFVDVNSVGVGKYVKGSLLEWKNFVTEEVVTIVSDCSYGDGEGLDIPTAFYSCYDEMVDSGYAVICKVNGLDQVYAASWYKYRSHNKEAICLWGERSKRRKVDIEENIHIGNEMRSRYMLMPAIHKPFKYKSALTLQDVKRLSRKPRTGAKAKAGDTSILSRICNVAVRHVGLWKELCFNQFYDKGLIKGDLRIDVETPLILYDHFETHGDVERLFESFHTLYNMEYDKEFGWIALSLK